MSRSASAEEETCPSNSRILDHFSVLPPGTAKGGLSSSTSPRFSDKKKVVSVARTTLNWRISCGTKRSRKMRRKCSAALPAASFPWKVATTSPAKSILMSIGFVARGVCRSNLRSAELGTGGNGDGGGAIGFELDTGGNGGDGDAIKDWRIVWISASVLSVTSA